MTDGLKGRQCRDECAGLELMNIWKVNLQSQHQSILWPPQPGPSRSIDLKGGDRKVSRLLGGSEN